MTKKEALDIKKIINNGRHYTTYYQSMDNELRIKVYEYGSCGKEYNRTEEMSAITKLLNILSSNGKRPEYRIDKKTYKGFVHITYVVIK